MVPRCLTLPSSGVVHGRQSAGARSNSLACWPFGPSHCLPNVYAADLVSMRVASESTVSVGDPGKACNGVKIRPRVVARSSEVFWRERIVCEVVVDVQKLTLWPALRPCFNHRPVRRGCSRFPHGGQKFPLELVSPFASLEQPFEGRLHHDDFDVDREAGRVGIGRIELVDRLRASTMSVGAAKSGMYP